jgi:hypothetical protein
MTYLVLGLSLLIGFALMARWYATADPAKVRGFLKWAFISIAIVAGLFFVFRGKLDVIWWIGIVAVPALLRWRAIFQALRNSAKAARGPTPGQQSSVNTAFFEMELDHDSGRMAGRVRAGQFSGRELASLGIEQLLELLAECADQDEQSAAVLESYLDQEHGPDWREFDGTESDARRGPSTAGGAMSREQALDVLGLEPGAGEEEIRDAHRRLMLANHPDKGGSTFLAAQINRAKDVLIGTG